METLSFRDPCTRCVEFDQGEMHMKRKGIYMTKFTLFLTILVIIIISGVIGFSVYHTTACERLKIAEADAPNSTKSILNWDSLTLPKTLIPLYYNLLIKPTFELKDDVYKYEGTVWIRFSPKSSIKQIDLNAKGLNIIKGGILDDSNPVKNEKLQMPLDVDAEKESTFKIIPKLVQFFQNEHDIGLQFEDLLTTENYESTSISTENVIETTPEPQITNENKMINSIEIYKSLKFEINEITEKLTFYLDKQLESNKDYILEIQFSGDIKYESSEFFWNNYTDNGETKLLISSRLRPTLARTVFPCFDEPSYRTPFEITIVRKSTMKSVSNTILKKSISRDGDLVWDYFEPTPPITPSTIFFMISELNQKNIQINDNVSLTIWSNQDIDHFIDQIDIIKSVLKAYYHIMVILNPESLLNKLNLIVLPGNYIIEDAYFRIINLRESQFLDKKLESTEYHVNSAKHISMQIGHALLSSVMKINNFNDVWTTEAILKYLSQLVLTVVEPSAPIFADQFLEKSMLMATDILDSIPSLVNSDFNILQVRNRNYDVYIDKGAALLNMYQNALGKDTFLEILRNYIQKDHNSNFWNILNDHLIETKIAKINLILPWLNQNSYPILNASINLAESEIILKQEHFSINPKRDFKWNIPISLMTSNYERKWSGVVKNWMIEKEMIITIPKSEDNNMDWIVINDLRTGFYRVNYDTETWSHISHIYINQPETFEERTRAQLLDDAFKLALRGYISINFPLNISKALYKEESLLVWQTAIENFKIVENILEYSSGYGAFKTYMKSLLNPIFSKTNFIQPKNIGNTYLEALVQKWSCYFGNTDCLATCQNLVPILLERDFPNDLIVVDHAESILCTAAAKNSSIWEKLYDDVENANEYKRNMLIKMLICTEEPWLLNRLFKKVIEIPDIRINEIITSLSTFQNAQGSRNVLRILKNRWLSIYEKYKHNPTVLSNFFQLLNKLNDEYDLYEYKTFIETNIDLMVSVRESLAIVEEQIKCNIEYKNKYSSEIVEWIMNNK